MWPRSLLPSCLEDTQDHDGLRFGDVKLLKPGTTVYLHILAEYGEFDTVDQ